MNARLRALVVVVSTLIPAMSRSQEIPSPETAPVVTSLPAQASDAGGTGRASERLHALEMKAALDAQQDAIRELQRQLAELRAQDVPPSTPPRWYERLGLRGYTQFRFGRTLSGDGAPLEVAADRSVTPPESFIIRRGRFIASGDITPHLFLYAQSELNASTAASDVSLQLRDLYADVALDPARTLRLRFGLSKVPFGFVNLQSSQARGPLERPDALNSAVEGERDMGAYVIWAPGDTRERFRRLAADLKGSGDYGVVSLGVFAGQGLNRGDQNGSLHTVARVSYPFTFGRQAVELGIQGYAGRFVTTTQPISVNGATVTPARAPEGELDRRLAFSAVWYASPVGVEAEWNVGTGPQLSQDFLRIDSARLSGGYVQLHMLRSRSPASVFPFVRWQTYDGGRKFARNAPRLTVNDLDLGVKFARWTEVEVTAMFSHTFERRRTSAFPYDATRNANRLGLQVQWNY